jgi:hypothetical protein
MLQLNQSLLLLEILANHHLVDLTQSAKLEEIAHRARACPIMWERLPIADQSASATASVLATRPALTRNAPTRALECAEQMLSAELSATLLNATASKATREIHSDNVSFQRFLCQDQQSNLASRHLVEQMPCAKSRMEPAPVFVCPSITEIHTKAADQSALSILIAPQTRRAWATNAKILAQELAHRMHSARLSTIKPLALASQATLETHSDIAVLIHLNVS